MRLLLMRHCQAAAGEEWSDHERPLTDKGRTDARAMGRWIADRGIRPDVVRCSSALRVRQTWSARARAFPAPPQPSFLRSIYLAGPDAMLESLQDVPDEAGTVMVVGHNPTVPQVLEALTGETHGFPAGSVAVVEVEGPWAGPGPGRLVDFARP